MGIYNRDYIREARPGGGFGGAPGGQWAIKYLLIANVAVFLAQNVDPRVTDWLSLTLGWRQVTVTKAEPVPFIEEERLQSGLPQEVAIPDGSAAETIPPGTQLEFLADYGKFAAVRWGDRYGYVRSAEVETNRRVDLATSWQVVWRLLTYGFCHGSFTHILFNLFVLWMFGRAVEPILGSREFMAFYLCGIAISGMGHILFSVIQSSPAGAVGASGGVMAVVFLTAMTYPKMKVLVMFVIPMDLWVMAVLYAAADTLGMFSSGSNVAHAAHLGGAAFGVAYKYYGWRVLPLWQSLTGRLSGWKRVRRNPNMRIFAPTDDKDRTSKPIAKPIDDRVDGILEKIHRQGEASLTDEERDVLKEASRRLKQK